MRSRQLIQSLIILLCVNFPFASAGAESARILHFPPDRSMGTLFIRDAGALHDEEWGEFQEAKGAVSVPEGEGR